MGKDERKPVSRIKIENLPRIAQDESKTGPFGFVTWEDLANDGVQVSIGSLLTFKLPQAIAMIIF